MTKNGDRISPDREGHSENPGHEMHLNREQISDDILDEIRELRVRIAAVLRRAETISKFFAA